MSPACGPTVSTQPNTTSSTAGGSACGAGEQGGDDVRAEIGRVRGGQAAAAAADRGAHGVDDERLGHRAPPRCRLLEHVLL